MHIRLRNTYLIENLKWHDKKCSCSCKTVLNNDLIKFASPPSINQGYRKKINGILLPKLFWPTMRKNCSSDREKKTYIFQ